jgi:Family of unknown function (DUF6113)
VTGMSTSATPGGPPDRPASAAGQAPTGSPAGRSGGTSRRLGRWVGALALGVLIGAVGTVLHRSTVPWGMALCLAVVLTSAVLVRAWAGLPGVLAYAVGWLTAVQVLSLAGPGGDVLVPAGDLLGYFWGLGGMVVIGVAAFLPSRWFRDAPAAA